MSVRTTSPSCDVTSQWWIWGDPNEAVGREVEDVGVGAAVPRHVAGPARHLRPRDAPHRGERLLGADARLDPVASSSERRSSTTSTPTTCRASKRSWPALLRGPGRPWCAECRVRCRDGSYRWVQGNARPDLAIERIYVDGRPTSRSARRSEEALVRQIAARGAGRHASPAGSLGADDRRHPRRRSSGRIEELARLDGRGPRPTSCAVADARRRVSYIEWLDPLTGQRPKDPFDRPPAVTQWWLDVIKDERLLQRRRRRGAGRRAPGRRWRSIRRADGVRSVLHVPLPSTPRALGVRVAGRRRTTAADVLRRRRAPLLRLAGEAFLDRVVPCATTAAGAGSTRAASSSTATTSSNARTRSWSGSPTPPPTI